MGKRQSEQLLKMFQQNGGQAKHAPRPETAHGAVAPPPNRNGGRAGATSSSLVSTSSATACDATISDDMLRTAVQVLQRLHDHPELFKSARFKGLRGAVFPLVQPSAASFVQRVSDAVADSRWQDAILCLKAMRETGEVPKLGSVQRWVRDCDLAGADDDPGLLCLDAILRTADPSQICPLPTPNYDPATTPKLLRQPPFEPQRLRTSSELQAIGDLSEDKAKSLASKFKILLREPPAVRKPPNLHEMILYTCPDNTVPMRAVEVAAADVVKHPVPFVPESMCLCGVLNVEEATTVVQVAEAVGFTPDVPLTGKKSILAHHFVWLADEAWIENLYLRCKPHLPAEIHGSKIVGINRRLRCYRYVPGSVYRPHVDGAWPQSGFDEASGEYVYDISHGKVSSKLTFLLYLNEGFEGGWTTYFTPAYEEGHLRATPVAPRIGTVMVFPHADTAGCLVHEGSGVISGTKYIIRTEVLYQL